MILRRVIEHVKAQNWFAVFLDFVIVVAGVFVGLQVQEWNQGRLERQQARVFVERLTRDFETIVERSEVALDKWQDVVESSEGLIGDFGDLRARGALPRPYEEFRTDMNGVIGGRIPAPPAPTFVEMLSAGEVSLLQDAALRDALLAYHAQAHFSLEAYRVLIARTQASNSLLITFMDPKFPDRAVDVYSGPLTSTSYDADVPGLAADPAVKGAIRNLGVAGDNHRSLAFAQLQKAREALAALKAQP